MVENIVGGTVKYIRSVNRTEFKNYQIELFCLQKGIEHQFNAPYTSHQDGVAERNNITLIEAARTMLADSKLLVMFWADPVAIACSEEDLEIKMLNDEVESSIHKTSDTNNAIRKTPNVEPYFKDDFNNPFHTQADTDAVETNLGEDLVVDLFPNQKFHKDHPVDNIIGNLNKGVQTRRSIAKNVCTYMEIQESGIIFECYSCFIIHIELKNYQMALKESSLVEEMQEELAQCKKMEVCTLMEKSESIHAIGTKWVFKCKKDNK
ncbi:uncharacterized protein LOC143585392 [Bidens hawaiensis]|uniref:uncharacterized protein LOC143585392 n=1 Tax=Bidens hawaiensis TaxID=980011 RepID=UPI004049D9ED